MKVKNLFKCDIEKVTKVHYYNKDGHEESIDFSDLSVESFLLIELFKNTFFKPILKNKIEDISVYKDGLDLGLVYSKNLDFAFKQISNSKLMYIKK